MRLQFIKRTYMEICFMVLLWTTFSYLISNQLKFCLSDITSSEYKTEIRSNRLTAFTGKLSYTPIFLDLKLSTS